MMQDQMGLFSSNIKDDAPLAFKVRPKELDQFFGQKSVLKKVSMLDFNKLPHIVLHGPPGCGKTTLANILASNAKLQLFSFNAVLGGVNDLRKIISEAINLKESQGKKSIIFIDEIHRFNKGQQDALLPHLEKGDFVLFGATTENPNTTLNKAILSRVQRWRLDSLSVTDIRLLLTNTLKNINFQLDSKLVDYIAEHSNGDARFALNQIETLENNKDSLVELNFDEIIKNYFFDNRSYDKNNERHYDVISAFIKSVRGSDVDAAILWLAVMLDGGEDIEFIARRLIILASEDIGNADPRALSITTDAHYAIKTIGMPEARIILAQAVTYLARAPKSNASYLAIDKALEYVKNNPSLEVPTHLRNHHPNKSNYKYPHSYENHWVKQTYMGEKTHFFDSSGIGYEKMQDDFINRTQNK